MSTHTFGSMTVKTFPAPAAGFDPTRASDEELERHGFPTRPGAVGDPAAAAQWTTTFGRYAGLEHLVPEFTPMEHRERPNLRSVDGSRGQVDATSHNWSGSVLFMSSDDTFTRMRGQWSVPHAYPGPNATGTEHSSAWLGLDGDGSDDVMQAGTETDSDGSCYAWFEWFPNFSIRIKNLPVAAGDVVALTLSAVSDTECHLTMGNLTSMKATTFSFSAPKGTTLAGNCAEAIMERPSINGKLAELPRYGEVFFDRTVAYSTSSRAYPIGVGTPISMVANDGTTVISAPEFDADTDAFKTAYTGP